MKNKLFTEGGFLSDFGKVSFALILDKEVGNLLAEAESENELRIIGSLIQQRVGQLVTDAVVKKIKE